MNEASGNGGVVTAVVEIIRKETGEKETYTLTGKVNLGGEDKEDEE